MHFGPDFQFLRKCAPCGLGQQSLQTPRKRKVLHIARIEMATGADTDGEAGIVGNGAEHAAQRGDVVDVFNRDAAVAVGKLPIIRQFADYFRGANKAGAARQDFERGDRTVKADREILLETADREATAQEFRYAPMGQEGKLEHAIGEAKFADLRPKLLFDLRPSMGDGHEADIHAPLFEQMQRRVDWAGPVLVQIEGERRAKLPANQLVERQKWRDRRLMALAAQKRHAARDIGT